MISRRHLLGPLVAAPAIVRASSLMAISPVRTGLTAEKLAALTRFSNMIPEDATIAVADWLAAEIAHAFAVPPRLRGQLTPRQPSWSIVRTH